MIIYIYETIPVTDEEATYHEIEQSETAEALTTHPDLGLAIRRVIVDGAPLTKKESCCGDDEEDSCCGGSSDCC